MIRKALLVTLALAVVPLVASAQSRPLPRVGVLTPSPPEFLAPDITAGMQAWLEDLGYVEGRNIQYAVRFGIGGDQRLPELASELVSRSAWM